MRRQARPSFVTLKFSARHMEIGNLETKLTPNSTYALDDVAGMDILVG